jgi:hypothetical protein
MKYTLLFINSFYTESIWSEKACQVLCVKFTLAKGTQLKLTLFYVSFKMGTKKQEKHMVNITFLFTFEGHEVIWEPWIFFFWMSGFLTRPDTNSFRHSLVWEFCCSSLELSQKARYQLTHPQEQSGPETFAPVPWSFLTRPNVDSHRQGPISGSDRCQGILYDYLIQRDIHYWKIFINYLA